MKNLSPTFIGALRRPNLQTPIFIGTSEPSFAWPFQNKKTKSCLRWKSNIHGYTLNALIIHISYIEAIFNIIHSLKCVSCISAFPKDMLYSTIYPLVKSPTPLEPTKTYVFPLRFKFLFFIRCDFHFFVLMWFPNLISFLFDVIFNCVFLFLCDF